jgi:DNA-binding NtrC family response regulator
MRRTNVLMVEDEPLISEMISEVLCENGFAVHAVADGETALRYSRGRAASGRAVHRHQPNGRMDGSVLAKYAHARRPEMPIVYCSGSYSPSALSPLMPRSVFLKKPYNSADLCTLLTRLTSAAH